MMPSIPTDRIAVMALLISGSLGLAESEFQKIYNDRHAYKFASEAELSKIDYDIGVTQSMDNQDELSADLQELIQQETNQKVIEFLFEAESLMAQATNLLEHGETGAKSIAIKNEVIEHLYKAAKAKSQSPENSKEQSEALLQMMQRMLEGEFEEKKSEGITQESSGDGEGADGQTDTTEPQSPKELRQRRIIKKSGAAPSVIPREFQDIIESYNRAIKK